MAHLRLLALCSLLLAACGPAEEEEYVRPAKKDAGVVDAGSVWPPYSIDGGYARFELEGWSVSMAEPLVTTQRTVGTKVVTLLTSDLRKVSSVLPAAVVTRLQKVPFFITVSEPLIPGGAYHPAEQWLMENGLPREWAKSITLGNAANYLDWTRIQPAMVLHELAHAWHDQVLGFDDAQVLHAFASATDGGVYDLVDYAAGGQQRAYALKNAHEYFAETTEAWFWRNDFKPFVKAELQSMDPEGAALMNLKWQP